MLDHRCVIGFRIVHWVPAQDGSQFTWCSKKTTTYSETRLDAMEVDLHWWRCSGGSAPVLTSSKLPICAVTHPRRHSADAVKGGAHQLHCHRWKQW